MTQPHDVAAIAAGLSAVERLVIKSCGDVADRFPCRACHAQGPAGCLTPISDRKAAVDACNRASAVVNGSGFDALSAHLQQVAGS